MSRLDPAVSLFLLPGFFKRMQMGFGEYEIILSRFSFQRFQRFQSLFDRFEVMPA